MGGLAFPALPHEVVTIIEIYVHLFVPHLIHEEVTILETLHIIFKLR